MNVQFEKTVYGNAQVEVPDELINGAPSDEAKRRRIKKYLDQYRDEITRDDTIHHSDQLDIHWNEDEYYVNLGIFSAAQNLEEEQDRDL